MPPSAGKRNIQETLWCILKMGQFADIYVAVKTRSKQQGINFLNHLETEKFSEYNLYWRNTDELNANKHGMLFYTKDEAIIFGISRDADIGGHLDTSNEDECLKLMKEYFQTDIGYITYEDTPYETFEEFVKEVNKLEGHGS